jgi:hypothetical protein
MPEPTRVDPFEQQLARLVRAYTQPAALPVDHAETARRAMAAPPRRWGSLTRWRQAGAGRRMQLVLVAAGILVLLGALALAGGSVLRRDGPGPLLFVRDGDLFVSALDGTGASRIRAGGADGGRLGYLTALWSPDMRAIAAVRDTGGPVLTSAVDIVGTDGAILSTVDLGRGGTPSISWSPDARRLAIATYPVDVTRNLSSRDDQVPSPVRLQVVDLDGTAREVALPTGARSWTAADPRFWTVPEIGVRWSPDGRWIAVRWDDPAAGQWHLVAADGSAVRDLHGASGGRCTGTPDLIDWFPDGRRVAVNGSGAAGANTLCVAGVGPGASSGPGLLAEVHEDPASDSHGRLGWPAVSPDGSRIASGDFLSDYAAQRHVTTLRVYDVASGRATDVATGTQRFNPWEEGSATWGDTLDGTPVPAAGAQWTPDGRQLLYLSPEAVYDRGTWTVRRVDADGGPSSVVVDGVRSFDIGGTD